MAQSPGKDVWSGTKCILMHAYEHTHTQTHTTYIADVTHMQLTESCTSLRAGQIHSRQPDCLAVAKTQIPIAITSTLFHNGANRAGDSQTQASCLCPFRDTPVLYLPLPQGFCTCSFLLWELSLPCYLGGSCRGVKKKIF